MNDFVSCILIFLLQLKKDFIDVYRNVVSCKVEILSSQEREIVNTNGKSTGIIYEHCIIHVAIQVQKKQRGMF